MPSTVITKTFTGFTLGTARAEVLRKLRQTDTVRYSPTKGAADYDWVDLALNSACQRFAVRTKCLRTFAILQMEAGYRTYKAPVGFIDIAAAYLYKNTYDNGYEQLTVKTVAEMNNEYSDWRTATGDEVEVIYVDRFHGTDSVLGVYPIPSASGNATPLVSDTADTYVWVCPIFANAQDYGVIINNKGDTSYILPNTTNEITADLEASDGNILLEFYRLPMDLLESSQNLEIPYSHQDDVISMAVADLLSNNPEDSDEFKRSQAIDNKVDRAIGEYVVDLKKPLTARNLRAITAVEGYVKNMDFRKARY